MKIACIFPGFGSQYVGMGKEVYDNQRIVQEYFEEAYNCLSINFVKLCFASSDEEITLLENAYLSLFLVSSSLFALLKENKIEPNWVAGYGMGSYSALYSAGAFTFPDGLYLIKKLVSFYKEFLDKHPLDALQVDISVADLEQYLFGSCNIATEYSSNVQIVVGAVEDISKLKEILSKHKIKIKQASVESCLNSPIFEDVANNFKIYLEKVDFKTLKLPYCSSFNRDISAQDTIRKEIVAQITQPNKWASVLKRLKKFDLVIEVGPGNVLTDLIKANHPEINVISFNKSSDIEKIMALIKTDVDSGEINEQSTSE